MTADRMIRALTALVVLAVAGFAAVVSYAQPLSQALPRPWPPWRLRPRRPPKATLAASIAADNPVSQRALASRFGITRPAAAKLYREVTAGANGDAAG